MLILSLLHDQIRNRHYHTRIHRTIPLPDNSAWDTLRRSQNNAAFIVTCGLTVTAFNKLYEAFKTKIIWYVCMNASTQRVLPITHSAFLTSTTHVCV